MPSPDRVIPPPRRLQLDPVRPGERHLLDGRDLALLLAVRRAEVGSERADSLLGRISALSMGIMFCLSPLLGAMTDRARKRMPFLVWATLICCCVHRAHRARTVPVSALLFIVANGAYQAGVQFYDSLLPDVTTEENRGRINGIAVGLGYTGSYIAVGAGLGCRRRAAVPVRRLLPVRRDRVPRARVPVLRVRRRAGESASAADLHAGRCLRVAAGRRSTR